MISVCGTKIKTNELTVCDASKFFGHFAPHEWSNKKQKTRVEHLQNARFFFLFCIQSLMRPTLTFTWFVCTFGLCFVFFCFCLVANYLSFSNCDWCLFWFFVWTISGDFNGFLCSVLVLCLFIVFSHSQIHLYIMFSKLVGYRLG